MAISSKMDWDLMNPILAQQFNNLSNNPVNNSVIIKNVQLNAGQTIINHGLGHEMNGWSIIDIQGPATIYRSAPLNSKTLTLTSSAAVKVSLEVF